MKKTLSTIMIVLTAIISLTLTNFDIQASNTDYSYTVIQDPGYKYTSFITIQQNSIILNFPTDRIYYFNSSQQYIDTSTSNAPVNGRTLIGDISNTIPNNAVYFRIYQWDSQGTHILTNNPSFASYSTPATSIPEYNPLEIVMQGGSSGLITFKHTDNIPQNPINSINQFAHVMEVTYPNNWFVTDIQWLWETDEQNVQNSTPVANQQIIPLKTITSGLNKITYFYLTGNSWTWPLTQNGDYYGLYLRVDGLNGDFETFTELAFAFAFDGTVRDINSHSGMERILKSLTIVAPTGTVWADTQSNQISLSSLPQYSTFDLPQPPSREGFVFSHWQIERNMGSALEPNWEYYNFTVNNRNDGKTIYHFFDFPNADPGNTSVRLTPIYTELVFYEVTFVDWDGTFISSGLVQQGQSAPLPTQPTRVGHTFTSWLPPVADIQGNITTVAQYDPILYTVTWRNVDFSTIGITQVAHGEIAVPIQYNAGAGFRVQGWTGNFGLSTPVTENRFYVVSIVEVENATGLTDLFSAVLGASVGSILTLGTIDLFGIQLSSLIYLFVFGSLALTFLKIIRGN
jgi:hypothetical protein